MKAVIEEIDLHSIKRSDAFELRNEILKATNNSLYFNNDYPRLKELYELLTGCFENSVNGVHTVSRRN